ncbi:MAG: DUF58 domain-containing protein [Gemmatimonadota bacterium]|nr:DUF58 domain-containing protein [Gemmatimonadota bacterium]
MSTPDYRKFLDPVTISKLTRLDLKARLVVEGFIAGLHRSPYHGFSVEYAQHRQYMPGDPIKYIDWKVFAKSDRFYVKEYEEETNLKSYIFLDVSASMGYSSEGISKLEYGKYLAAALTYLMLSQQDSVGLVLYDERVRQYVPPRAVGSQLHTVLQQLNRADPQAGTSSRTTFHALAERIKRRGLIIIISDLLEGDSDDVISGIKHFRHRRHEVIVFRLLDPAEQDFSFDRPLRFRDLETGEEIFTDPNRIRDQYLTSLQDQNARYEKVCRENYADYTSLDTTTPFDYALMTFLGKRSKLG